jgi:multiple antibiotic resistance protein
VIVLDAIVPFLKELVLIPLTLLPIINPLSSAPVLLAQAGGDRALVKRLARQVAVNSFYVVIASMLVGTNVLAIFGISLPILRVGGGLLVCATAWRMLRRPEGDDVQEKAAREASGMAEAEVVRRSFFPLTFPLTTGPGTIAVAIALGAQFPRSVVPYLLAALVATAGVAATALVLYVFFSNAGVALEWLGEMGALVMMRLIAFILLCVGLQIMWTGWAELNMILPQEPPLSSSARSGAIARA